MSIRTSSLVLLPVGRKQEDVDLCGLPEPELLLVANLSCLALESSITGSTAAFRFQMLLKNAPRSHAGPGHKGEQPKAPQSPLLAVRFPFSRSLSSLGLRCLCSSPLAGVTSSVLTVLFGRGSALAFFGAFKEPFIFKSLLETCRGERHVMSRGAVPAGS